ncbi:MAG: cupin domain-containing protein, partial [Polyangiales bacterium]
MAVLPAPSSPTHSLPGARFTSLATPLRGSRDTSVWRVELAPGTPATVHQVKRELGDEAVHALCCMPVGGQARLADGT